MIELRDVGDPQYPIMRMLEMEWLIGSAPDFWGRGPGFDSWGAAGSLCNTVKYRYQGRRCNLDLWPKNKQICILADRIHITEVSGVREFCFIQGEPVRWSGGDGHPVLSGARGAAQLQECHQLCQGPQVQGRGPSTSFLLII